MNFKEFMRGLGNQPPKQLAIESVVYRLNCAQREIEEQAKYHNLQWKKDALTALKADAIAAFMNALDEANTVNKQFEDQINSLLKQQYTGPKVNKDDIATIEYELKSLKAELNMSSDKSKVIDRYLATQTGAKAVMLMFSEKDLDLGLWSQSVYEQAFIKSKSKAELDFEAQKAPKLAEIQKEQAAAINIGKVFAAQRILTGNPSMKMPSLERRFDLDIQECEKEMLAERESLKAAVRRDIAIESAAAGGDGNE